MASDTLDVVIVGAGLAGLCAAKKLVECGHRDILVLEARDRVGGRTLTTTVEGQVVDLGGQWIGPGQRRELRGNPYPTLRVELNTLCPRIKQAAKGTHILLGGRGRRESGGQCGKDILRV